MRLPNWAILGSHLRHGSVTLAGMVHGVTGQRVKGWRRWVLLVALLAGCDGREGAGSAVDGGHAQQADGAAGSPPDAGAGSMDVGSIAAADALSATAADAAADALADAPTTADGDAVADASGATAADAVAADADVDAAVDATPSYAPAAFGGEFLVDLGGSADDGVSIQPWTLPGQQAPLIFGPQGGYHIWVSVCVPAALGSKAGLKILASLPDGSQVDPGVTELTSKLVAVPGKTGQVCRVAAPAFVTCACELHGVPLRVRVDVTDLSAAPGTAPAKKGWAEKTVVPQHKLGPCWTKGSAPCTGRRGLK